MFSIVSENREIGIVERPTYIRLQDNGYYILADESDAQGITFNGSQYQLGDRADMGNGLPVAMLNQIDIGNRISAQTQVASIAFVTMAEAGSIDGVTAGEHLDMFAEWSGEGVNYVAGNLRRYSDKLWKCLQNHKSQPDWTPDTAVSLWVQTADPAEEWPQWSKPVGAHDSYNTGDKVTYNGEHYTSTMDGNTWAPDEYPAAWEKQE